MGDFIAGSELLNALNLLDKTSAPRGNGAILCTRPKLSALNAENYIVPIWLIEFNQPLQHSKMMHIWGY